MDNILTKLGFCYLKDKNAFQKWLFDIGYRRKSPAINSGLHGGWFDDNWQGYFYTRQTELNLHHVKNIFHDSIDETDSRHETAEFFKFLDYLEKNNQKMAVFYSDNFATICGYSQNRYVLPTEWLEIELLKDYNHLSAEELKVLGLEGGVDAALAIVGDDSMSDLKQKVSEKQSQISCLNDEMTNVKEAKTKELRALQEEIEKKMAELEEKKRSLMAELKKKQDELQEQVEELQNKVFMLETQIYGIRCYLGEVVDFVQLCSGKEAAINEPIVLFQKIRFLDEEMGKAIALYDFDANDCDTFQDVLIHRDDIRELFIPTEKCISLVRISRTGSYTSRNNMLANMLCKYETYHGSQLGVIIRNGENIHIAWLDEDKITIHDENMFFTAKKDISHVDDHPTVGNSRKDEIVSRYFIFSLLQGILDNSTLVSIPETANILKESSPYIVFSAAEGWLNDTTYGMFSDIMHRVNEIPLHEGDMVLTALRLTRDDDSREARYRKYNNDRGIGEKNRTHDAFIPSFKIVPVNKVIKEATYEFTVHEFKVIHEEEKIQTGENSWSYKTIGNEITDELLREKTEYHTYTADDKENGCVGASFVDFKHPEDENNIRSMVDDYNKYYCNYVRSRHYCDSDTEYYAQKYISGRFTGMEYNYYLSAYKSDSQWSDKGPSYANLQFYRDETIPLNYLNSGWTMYAITTKNIGSWSVGGCTLSYTDALKYLNRINSFLKERETKEMEMLKAAGLSDWVDQNSDWMVKICEWRIENRIRNLTPYQAKRFKKHLMLQ